MTPEAILCGLAIIALVVTNVLWFRHLRYLTNLAIAKTPVEFATLQVASGSNKPSQAEKPKRIRPEGI